MPVTRRQYLGLAGATTVGLAGCTDGGTGSADGSGTPTGEGMADGATVVSLANTAFDPVRASVDPGGTVEWVNEDGVAHDVTAARFHDVAADWDIGAELGPDERTSHTFDEPGVYEYSCTIHGKGTMCGAVLVGDASLTGDLPCEGADEGGGGGDGGYY